MLVWQLFTFGCFTLASAWEGGGEKEEEFFHCFEDHMEFPLAVDMRIFMSMVLFWFPNNALLVQIIWLVAIRLNLLLDKAVRTMSTRGYLSRARKHCPKKLFQSIETFPQD